MSKIIYHKGTDTYFGLDDDVVVIDSDVSEWDEELDDQQKRAVALTRGSAFDHAYVSINEAILLNELAIKSEADAWLDVFGDALPEEVPAFRWAADASAEELEYVAGRVLSDDYLWEQFTMAVRDAIRETWESNNNNNNNNNNEGDSK